MLGQQQFRNYHRLERRWKWTPISRRSPRSTKVQRQENWRQMQRVREEGGERNKIARETGHIEIHSEKQMNGKEERGGKNGG